MENVIILAMEERHNTNVQVLRQLINFEIAFEGNFAKEIRYFILILQEKERVSLHWQYYIIIYQMMP